MEKASIFISWSGTASRLLSSALREWLPRMFQTVEPFTSSEDIAAGTLWFDTIGDQLRRSDFAIICVTPDNLESAWLHFEAGAIGMALNAEGQRTSRSVVPYLMELEPPNLKPPLSLYQALTTSEEETRRLAQALNHRVPAPLSQRDLDETFAKWWPDLEAGLETARKAVAEGPPPSAQRSERELLEELLSLNRASLRGEATGREKSSTVNSRLRQRVRATEAANAASERLGIPLSVRPSGASGVHVVLPWKQELSATLLDELDTIFAGYGLTVDEVEEEEPF